MSSSRGKRDKSTKRNKTKSRTRLRATSIVILLFLISTFFVAMSIAPSRLILEQQKKIEQAEQELSRVKALNQELQEEIINYQTDEYVEREARRQFGMVRPGEKAYIVIDE
jgi:cell division protein FtsB